MMSVHANEHNFGKRHVQVTHAVDEDNMIWLGMPDMPEPECSMEDLPIWRYHSDRAHYAQFPYSALLTQLELLHKENAPFNCFICQQTHTS